MNEWKNLEINNLPPDILTGDYEWEVKNEFNTTSYWGESHINRLDILTYMSRNKSKYRYRKPEPKQPTHEEIMTKWWKLNGSSGWQRVDKFTTDSAGGIYHFPSFLDGFNRIQDFIGRESADIPPEE